MYLTAINYIYILAFFCGYQGLKYRHQNSGSIIYHNRLTYQSADVSFDLDILDHCTSVDIPNWLNANKFPGILWDWLLQSLYDEHSVIILKLFVWLVCDLLPMPEDAEKYMWYRVRVGEILLLKLTWIVTAETDLVCVRRNSTCI